MSRSYKRTALLKGGGFGKFGKRMANRRIRANKNFYWGHCAYKREFERYAIYDYRFSALAKYGTIKAKELKDVAWEDKKYYVSK